MAPLAISGPLLTRQSVPTLGRVCGPWGLSLPAMGTPAANATGRRGAGADLRPAPAPLGLSPCPASPFRWVGPGALIIIPDHRQVETCRDKPNARS